MEQEQLSGSAGVEQSKQPEECGGSEGALDSGQPRRSHSRNERRGQKEPLLVAGKEVVGRQLAVWSQKLLEWPKATVAQFNAETGQHMVRYMERKDGEVKHEEVWVCLGTTRFQWLTTLAASAPPNPTHAGAPQKEDAVGYKVKVFWPGMARWYLGKIVSYDPKNRMHKVKYRDGDIQELTLRHEAVQYLQKETMTEPRVRVDTRRCRDRSKHSTWPGGSKRAREEGSIDDLPSKSNKSSSTADERGTGQRAVSARGPVVAGGSGDASAATLPSDEDLSGSEPDSGEVDSGDDSGMPSMSGAESDDLGSDAFLTEEEDSDFEVESARNKRRPGSRAGGGLRSRSRQVGEGRRGTSSSARRASDSRARSRREVPPSRTFRPKLVRSDDEAIKSAGGAVVGARVSVFWQSSETHSRGKLIQFDGYHKRHKMLYDDGQEEWVSLSREAFRWLTPRGRSAGCTRDFRAAMGVLGAEQASTRQLRSSGIPDDGAVVPRAPAAAAIGAPAPSPHGQAVQDPPCGDACVGWQVSLLFDGDSQWYRGQVLGHDRRRGRHLILYDDGEDEWLVLDQETIVFIQELAGGPAVTGIYPGVLQGSLPPSGEAAVGWRVSVYWAHDMVFYPGELVGYDASGDSYNVAYDDGDEASVSLASDKLKFVLPPGHRVDPERLENAGMLGLPRRRLGDDSDPDYEFEARPRPAQRRLGPRSGLCGGMAGLHPWDTGPESTHLEGSSILSSGPTQRFPGLPGSRSMDVGGLPVYPVAPVAPLVGDPLVSRQVDRMPTFGSFAAEGQLILHAPITVRIYMSSTSSSTSRATSTANPSAILQLPAARLEARMQALDHMARRVGRAQQALVKGLPTSLPPVTLKSGEDVPPNLQHQQQHVSPVMLGPGHHQRHSSSLHRLAGSSAVNVSPFSRRQHSVTSNDDQTSSSTGGSDMQEAAPLSPLLLVPGGKVRAMPSQVAGQQAEQPEDEDSLVSTGPDMLPTSGMVAMQHSPGLSPYKGPLGLPPRLPGQCNGEVALASASSLGAVEGLMPPISLAPISRSNSALFSGFLGVEPGL